MTDLKIIITKSQKAPMFYVFIVIFETHIMLFIKKTHPYDIVKWVLFTMKPFFLFPPLHVCRVNI